MNRRHYLDHASTSPLRPEAAAAVSALLTGASTGDPARVHAEGRWVRDEIERARESVAGLLGTAPARIVFTSGATEAVNTAVFSAGAARPGAAFIHADVEHSCVRDAAARLGPLLSLRVDAAGRVDLAHLAELLASTTPAALVSCQWCNHEVGTLQPVAEVVALCREAGVPTHVDAASAVGHVPVALDELGADFVSVSSHKFGGPTGTGALFVRRGVRLQPLLVGGAQERARRAGLENMLGIVGFGAAAAAMSEPGRLESEAAAARALTEELLAVGTSVPEVVVLGDPRGRAPHIVNLAVGGVLAEAVLLGLDRAGIAAHSGSACSSESIEPSPVLAAMGADPDRSLRLSVGWSSARADVEAFAAAFPGIVSGLRALAAG